MNKHASNEIICPNCNSLATGNFCAQCGQPTHLHKETFWHMVWHFAGHYFHFESKFWGTLKTLILKPGELTLAWKQKQRMRYVEPINLYMFVSVVFFIVVSYTVGYIQKTSFWKDAQGNGVGEVEYGYAFGRYGFKDIRRLENHKWITDEGWQSLNEQKEMLVRVQKEYPLKDLPGDFSRFIQYPNHESFGYVFYNYFVYKYAYRHKILNEDEAVVIVVEKFLHLIPKVFFILMPVLALLLNMIFLRRKSYYFLDHGVMSLHTHIFLFLCAICQLSLGSFLPLGGNFWLFLFYILIPFVHFAIATHKFYKITWLRAVVAASLTWFMYLALVFLISVTMLLLLILYS